MVEQEGPQPGNNSGVTAIVLAAGKSTRMRSKLPKGLHLLWGRPLLAHILEALAQADVTRRIVVVGHQADAVRTTLDARYGNGVLEYAEQLEQKGTGHAAQMTASLLADYSGDVLIVPGDAPLLSGEVLASLIAAHRERNAAATLLTAVLKEDAGSYGRVVRDSHGDVVAIVEARDASPDQKRIREINTSVYAFSAPRLFAALQDLRPDNAQGELYLTDVIRLLRDAGETVGAVVADDEEVALGINTKVELAEVGEKMRRNILRKLMLSGVTIPDPATTYVDAEVSVGSDTILYPGTHLRGATTIGEDCEIGPNADITDTLIGNNVRARYCVMELAEVGDRCKIGPYAHLRPGAILKAGVRIGNFVEIKAAILHEGVAAGHLSYLGDAEIGERTNIGAGTITCNYDGFKKHRTVIGANSFIGTHSTLVAPVVIGNESFTAAGSVITKEVPDGALAVARERQVVREGWWIRRKREKEAQTS